MDPLTQGLFGAAAAQSAFGGRVPRAWLVGLAAGMAADLDVLIRSDADPLLAIEYHRHFTHALAFIPIGGLLAVLPFFLFRRWRAAWKATCAAGILAYATHGFLDACTTYGTVLLWPFSTERIAWSWISIIDPVFTLILILGIAVAARARARWPAQAALGLAGLILMIGAVQHERALHAQAFLASEREHEIARGDAFPTLGNHLVWRSLYQSGDKLYSDRIRVPWFGSPQWTPGESVEHVTVDDLPVQERENPRIRSDFERFSWFADGWVAEHPGPPAVYGDVRYSLKTEAFDPIWGVRFEANAKPPTRWVSRTTERELGLGDLWTEILGTSTDYQPLAPLREPD